MCRYVSNTVVLIKLRARSLRSCELYERTGLSSAHFGELVERLWLLHPDTEGANLGICHSLIGSW